MPAAAVLRLQHAYRRGGADRATWSARLAAATRPSQPRCLRSRSRHRSPPRSRWPERLVAAAILIAAATLAGLATYFLARSGRALWSGRRSSALAAS